MARTESEKELRTQKKIRIHTIKAKAKADICDVKIQYAADPVRARARADAKIAAVKAREQRRSADALMPRKYSIGEEIFNSVSHGVGAGLSVAATVLLVLRAVFQAPVGKEVISVTSFSVFGGSLLILYLMSTLYHALTPYGVKNVFQIFDHSSIYLLIAGTYTPYCLVGLSGRGGWVLFGIIWGMAILGITVYAVFGNKMRLISSITYIVMGWIVFFAFRSLYAAIPRISFIFLVTGGIAYTVGCPFYMLKKIKWTHSIFHLFVLMGSIFHFFSVYFMI
jgi:hemolysin III